MISAYFKGQVCCHRLLASIEERFAFSLTLCSCFRFGFSSFLRDSDQTKPTNFASGAVSSQHTIFFKSIRYLAIIFDLIICRYFILICNFETARVIVFSCARLNTLFCECQVRTHSYYHRTLSSSRFIVVLLFTFDIEHTGATALIFTRYR